MAEVQHKLEIFRGLLKFRSNQSKIWAVLIVLSIVTIIEVALGIIKPKALLELFLGMKILNWIFVILTFVKAYYITWDFMHMRDEKSGLRNSVVLPLVILVLFLVALLLVEADYIFQIKYNGFLSWDF
ncbi:MAG: cytochrome C oxidase subunit IV family protein [Flavobacteriaceae bacterium]|nr:cytochrome C oxidase subunit IV family protein [Flavobacteriaceae bacterium]